MPQGEPSPVEIVEQLVERTNAGEVDSVLELLSEEYVVEIFTGQVYIGHDGYVDMLTEHFAPFESLQTVPKEIREVADGYVLHEGTVVRKRPREEPEAIPGFWLHRIEDGRIRATVYYRTREEALNALPARP